MKTIAGSQSEIHYLPYDQVYGEGFEDMPRRVPDISKIHSTIDWEPRVDLDEMIRRVIEFHSKRSEHSCTRLASTWIMRKRRVFSQALRWSFPVSAGRPSLLRVPNAR